MADFTCTFYVIHRILNILKLKSVAASYNENQALGMKKITSFTSIAFEYNHFRFKSLYADFSRLQRLDLVQHAVARLFHALSYSQQALCQVYRQMAAKVLKILIKVIIHSANDLTKYIDYLKA